MSVPKEILMYPKDVTEKRPVPQKVITFFAKLPVADIYISDHNGHDHGRIYLDPMALCRLPAQESLTVSQDFAGVAVEVTVSQTSLQVKCLHFVIPQSKLLINLTFSQQQKEENASLLLGEKKDFIEPELQWWSKDHYGELMVKGSEWYGLLDRKKQAIRDKEYEKAADLRDEEARISRSYYQEFLKSLPKDV